MRLSLVSRCVIAAITVCMFALSVTPSRAATLTINATTDFSDANPGDLNCQTTPANGSVCTLRAAIETANANVGTDTIQFSFQGTVMLTSALPALTESVIINGAGADAMFVDANATGRIFDVPTGITVTITQLGLREGSATDGAAIRNAGTLTLREMSVSASVASMSGGGVYNSGMLVIRDSTISGNSAGDGAGVYNAGAPVGGSPSPIAAGPVLGGTVTIINSTISGNTATASGDITSGSGGGLYLAPGSEATLRNSTIAFNGAAVGGGVAALGSFIPANTLIARNTATTSAPDVSGTIDSLGHNLIGNSTGAVIIGTTDGNLLDAAAAPVSLVALSSNGGRTRTHVIGVNSVAIDAGDQSLAVSETGFLLANDQRGAPNNRARGEEVDIGAYESTPTTLTIQTTLQGRSQPAPHPSRVFSGRVRITRGGDGAVFFDGMLTSDNSGVLSMFGLPPFEFYRFWVKGSHTLASISSTVTVVGGATTFTTVVLREGDANNDNVINITDFSILAATFGKVSTTGGFDGRADFNADNAVNINDFSLLAANFGVTGDAIVGS